MKIYEPQPAYLMYPFGKGWKVLRYVWDNIFPRTQTAADWWFSHGADMKTRADFADGIIKKFWYLCAYFGFRLGGLVHFVAAYILVFLFAVVQSLFLSLWAALDGILIVLLFLFNFGYSSFLKIFFRCPVCHNQMDVPAFICPSCSTEHTRLIPSAYGIFHHRCTCGNQLSTIDFIGRKNLSRKCPECGQPLNKEIGARRNFHISIVGGPYSGKTIFMTMAVREFINSYALPRGFAVDFPEEKERDEYDRNVAYLARGEKLAKTTDSGTRAYNLTFKRPGDLIGNILYVYDAAGEVYTNMNAVTAQEYFRYADGIVFIIDPFSITYYADTHREEIGKISQWVAPSTLKVDAAYERMLNKLETISSGGVGRLNQPLAIVITKTDALDLDAQIGDQALKNYQAANPTIRETEARRALIENFLIANHLGNMVRDLHLRFANVAYFASSALGRLPQANDARPFVPAGVLDPFLWILNTAGLVSYQRDRSAAADKNDWEYARKQAGGNPFIALKIYLWDSLRSKGE
jgi:hypothetical protein